MRMNLLLTAFDPFGGEKTNPALDAVNLMPETLGSIHIRKLELPTSFCRSGDILAAALSQYHPDTVLCIGQAGGRSGITVERTAVNIDDTVFSDNDGYAPADVPVFPNGPTAYFATVPVKKMVESIKNAGIPCLVSNSAGTFVCNHIMYTLLHIQAQFYPGTSGGFIHVPFTPSQAVNHPGQSSMSIENIVQALTAAVKSLE